MTTVANLFREEFAGHSCRGFNGFRHLFTKTLDTHRSYVARACIAGTTIDLQRSPVLSIARPRLVRAVQQFNFAFHYLEQQLTRDGRVSGGEIRLTEEERLTFADMLLQGSDLPDVLELRRRFLQPMQQQLTEHYARRDYSTLGGGYPESLPRFGQGASFDRPVDVIVPVYAGYEQTKRCLESVLASPISCRYELICVLDNPDDRAIGKLVREYAARNAGITVVENVRSRGFAESVNLAMKLHRDRDVLLLHSDCEVHGDWLGRLRRAAYEGAGAGLVNPLTNQGEFLSYPSAGIPLPADARFETLDDFAWRANKHATLQIPAAMGFCLYIRRDCIEELGFLHNDEASGGYYAEKYFGVNAASRGWRSILATGVFVKHEGNVSFSKRHPQAVEQAREAFDLWCPYYRDTVTDFLVDDPALTAKRELDLARLEAVGSSRFCFISHGGGGGTERHLKDLSHALAKHSIGSLMLFSLPGRSVFIAATELEGIENLSYRLDTEWGALVRDLKRLNIRMFHVHSNVGVDSELFALPTELDVPYDITVHDYGWFCPRVNLVNRSGVYCGEPPVPVCDACTEMDVAKLVTVSQEQLEAARRVYCPSEDARQRMERHFALSNVTVRPHLEGVRAPKEEAARTSIVKIAIIGRIATHKGLRVLRECAAHALEWMLPLQFTVIGGVTEEAQFERLTNVEITGAYEEDQVDELVARHGARVALLPSVWPETYCYTLSIALRNGLFPVAFDLGAIAERMRRAGTGTLLPLGISAASINQALMVAGRRPVKPAAPSQSFEYQNMLRDYYGIE